MASRSACTYWVVQRLLHEAPGEWVLRSEKSATDGRPLYMAHVPMQSRQKKCMHFVTMGLLSMSKQTGQSSSSRAASSDYKTSA